MAEEDDDDDDAPLPLNELRERVSAKTYAWLVEEQNDDNRDEDEEIPARNLVLLFGEQEEEEEEEARVKEWSSSATYPDGFGGYYSLDENDKESTRSTSSVESPPVKVQYVLSASGKGHGDDIWAASRHISNLMASKEKCQYLLAPIAFDRQQHSLHPLLGLSFVELGAGGGIPSWTAMRCGARVVCTDQTNAERIRCLAECAERNLRDMSTGDYTTTTALLLNHATKVRVCPYDWGSPSIEEVTEALDTGNNANRFDVVVAADCIYIPALHSALLDSIQKLMRPDHRGIALLPFALHGNTTDESVWGIVERAQQKGFQVEVLEPQQLTPQISTMDSKRGLVHTLRLTLAS